MFNFVWNSRKFYKICRYLWITNQEAGRGERGEALTHWQTTVNAGDARAD